MKNRFFLLLSILLSNYCFSQITLESPVEHGVYQRNSNNEAQIAIFGKNGTSTKKIDKIEYKADLYQDNDASNSAWTKVDSLESDSTFYGIINLKQGWYKFAIRYWADGKIIKQDSLNRVGVGEVFIIVGQSNASGDRTFGIIEPQDERVITLSNYYLEFDAPNNIAPVFTKMEQYGYIGPSGRTAWFWGNLGDRLVARLQVPVLFLNAASSGSILNQWAKSQVIAKSNTNRYPAPFGTILNTILRFGNEFGVRSILWMQGESDTAGGTSTSQYFNELKNMIEALRKMTKKPKLTWTISRTSYTKGIVSPSVILAQNYVIGSMENMWQGPESDLIIGSENRSDDTHFSGQGLMAIAEAWEQRLNDDFFKYTYINDPIPQSVKYRNPKFTATYNDKCFSTNIALTPKISPTTVLWNTETTTEPSSTKKVINKGEYWYHVDTPTFRSINSEPTFVELNIQPEAPKIIYTSKTLICEGDSIILKSNLTEKIIWNNTLISDEIYAKKTGDYTVKQILNNGCFSKEAKVNFTFTKPLPKLIINNTSNNYTICQGDSALIKVTNTLDSLLWSVGGNENQKYINKKGNYWVNYKKNNGCITENTNFTIDVKLRPERPIISTKNSYELQASGGNDLYNWYFNNEPMAEHSNKLTTYTNGNYSVTAENRYKIDQTFTLSCISGKSEEFVKLILATEKENIEVKFYPNPVLDKTVYFKSPLQSNNNGVYIYNTKGQIIYQQTILNNERKIILPKELPKGIYYFQWFLNGQNYISKLLIE